MSAQLEDQRHAAYMFQAHAFPAFIRSLDKLAAAEYDPSVSEESRAMLELNALALMLNAKVWLHLSAPIVVEYYFGQPEVGFPETSEVQANTDSTLAAVPAGEPTGDAGVSDLQNDLSQLALQ